MKNSKVQKEKRSFEDRLLALRFKNSKERDFLFGKESKDEKRKETQKES